MTAKVGEHVCFCMLGSSEIRGPGPPNSKSAGRNLPGVLFSAQAVGKVPNMKITVFWGAGPIFFRGHLFPGDLFSRRGQITPPLKNI